ncbi:hypothetical protein [Escherichia coli]|uniref:hypothetical protein n=2 Tax=Escherichia coli TaxID=562 RepID=UPI001CC605B4|nr:hypothetical protein [Escherichia coli]
MGIAASYTMHLYCDCRQCTDGKYQSPDFGEYIGTSWAGCAKEARKDGWRISADKTRAFAPGHKILRRSSTLRHPSSASSTGRKTNA